MVHSFILRCATLYPMKKDKAIIKTAIEQNLIERSQVIYWLILSSISLITTIVIWKAVYGSGQQIGNYNLNEMVTYSFISFILRRIRIHTHWGVTYAISTGQINNYLLLPYNYLRLRFLKSFGKRIVANQIISLPVFLGLAIIYKSNLLLPGNKTNLLILLFAVIPMTIFLNYLYTTCIGLVSFWTTEITGLFYLIGSISSFLGGALFPISAFPKTWQLVLKALPFRYLFAFPIDIYLGKLNQQQIYLGLIVQVLWVISFYIILRIIWHFGLRRHEAYGG